MDRENKRWICGACARAHGKRVPIGGQIHYGTCDWCGQTKGLTEAKEPFIIKTKKEADDEL